MNCLFMGNGSAANISGFTVALTDGRGNGDYLLSHDIEDMIAVMDGRPELAEEVRQSELALVDELATRFQELLEDKQFVDAVSGHMPTDEVSQSRVEQIFNTIKNISYKK